jgi:hypothetical protein
MRPFFTRSRIKRRIKVYCGGKRAFCLIVVRLSASPIMKAADKTELNRSCGLLKCIDERTSTASDEREALRKAALALDRVFIAGGRLDIEESFAMIDQPLLESERAHLRSLGIDPDIHQASQRAPANRGWPHVCFAVIICPRQPLSLSLEALGHHSNGILGSYVHSRRSPPAFAQCFL